MWGMKYVWTQQGCSIKVVWMKTTKILEIIHNKMFDVITLIIFKCTGKAKMEIKLSYAKKSTGDRR
jgi:hypothetical protein